MYSILKEIDQYIIENGIPFKNIKVSYTYFSKYVNQVILELMRDTKACDEFELGPREYTIEYDELGQIYLLATDEKRKHSNLIICSNPNNLKVSFPHKTFSERRVIEVACEYRYLDEYRLMIRKIIRGKELSMRDRVELENSIIRETAFANYKKLKSEEKKILDMVDYEGSLRDSVTALKKYIDYLNHEYQEEVIAKEVMHGISYKEPVPESDAFRRGPREFGVKPTKERKNAVMGAEERIEVLEEHTYVYKDYAFTGNNKEIEYMVYLYNVRDNEFVLVMEPYNGVKYTKIVVLHEKEINREVFNALVKRYLELSNNEFALMDNVARSSHTTIDTFRESMNYAILGGEVEKATSTFKKKIKSIKDNR